MPAVRLRISLDDIEPVIWRRVLVPARFTLNGLHRVIQAAFLWEDYHLHRFEIGRVRYEHPDLVEWDPPGRECYERLRARGVDPVEIEALCTPPRDERKIRLSDLVDRGVHQFEYLYDFGDDWSHTIEIEGVQQVDVGRLPALLDGERSGPPEDSGGLPGYQQIQDVFAGKEAESWGQELAEWVRAKMGPRWTPETLDTGLIEDRLSHTWRGPRR